MPARATARVEAWQGSETERKARAQEEEQRKRTRRMWGGMEAAMEWRRARGAAEVREEKEGAVEGWMSEARVEGR